MPATLWLLSLALSLAQAPPAAVGGPATLALAPRLQRGQEIVYRGSFREESHNAGVRHQRTYRLSTRYFILHAGAKESEVAALTLVQDRSPDRPGPVVKEEKSTGSVRLEKLLLTRLGKVTSPRPETLFVPVDGPPTLEIGALVEVPDDRLRMGQAWERREPGRPPVAWQVAGRERLLERNCIKLIAVQQSEEWERGRADRGAWKRVETIWFDPEAGHTVRLERTISQRDPARREISQSSFLRLELDSNIKKPDYLTEPTRVEIAKALDFRERALPLLANPVAARKDLTGLQRRITQYVQGYPATPYRDAVLAVQRLVDAGCKGEVIAQPTEAPRAPAVAKVGAPAPDFLASEITGTGTGRLSRWKGKPIVMVFYHPASGTAPELVRFAGNIHQTLGRHVTVLGLSVSDDAASVLKQQSLLRVSFPVLHGSGLRKTYAAESTPTIVVIDGDAIVRGIYVGWGHQTAAEVMTELRRWLSHR